MMGKSVWSEHTSGSGESMNPIHISIKQWHRCYSQMFLTVDKSHEKTKTPLRVSALPRHPVLPVILHPEATQISLKYISLFSWSQKPKKHDFIWLIAESLAVYHLPIFCSTTESDVFLVESWNKNKRNTKSHQPYSLNILLIWLLHHFKMTWDQFPQSPMTRTAWPLQKTRSLNTPRCRRDRRIPAEVRPPLNSHISLCCYRINTSQLFWSGKTFVCVCCDSSDAERHGHGVQRSEELQARYEWHPALNPNWRYAVKEKKSGHGAKKNKIQQETGLAPSVNTCIVSERMSH